MTRALAKKAALAADVDALVADARIIAGSTPVHAIDALAGIGADEPARYLTPGRTAVLLGSSGVGKSTLLNHLAGEELSAIGDIRARDARGCHTTTRRELFVLPRGGLLLAMAGTLRAAAAERAGSPGTPAETELLDVFDGIIVALVRGARKAARAAAKRLGRPALAVEFELTKLYGPRAAAKPPAGGEAPVGGGTPPVGGGTP